MKIILYGPDTYRSKLKLAYWQSVFVAKKDPTGVNMSIIDAGLLDVNSFRKLVLSSGLFSDKRLVIINKFFQRNKEEGLDEEVLEFLKRSGRDEKNDNSLIFFDEEVKEGKMSKTKKQILAYLLKQKYSQEFPLLSKGDLSAWVQKQLLAQRKKIEPAAISYLVKEVGPDLWRLTNEINKLIASPEKIVVLDLVKKFVPPQPEEEIWPLVDALGDKNKIKALKLLRDQLDIGNDVFSIFGMLVRQYRILILAREAIDQEGFVNGFALAKRLGLHPFVCQKAIRQIKNYNLIELKKIYQQLLQIDLKTKTSPVDPETLLDLLIIK
ncbi:MAG: DNA polymerase III subunit delta [Patescibacteria group bacterium]|nr:DNA polymerase III subunit delta [Patescibacteria group bacterium]MDD5121210.1 DNA polymerase III subunit delta [Patescibacteria group bacterium]MDD5221761.1 DNA polymerase III subunit delta [Patescibacteria group bacterium]MDD5395871.1 DNA polymerase III subunit delta [Patescibacteria group bacterium]